MLTKERIHEIAGPADYYDRVVFARSIEAEVRKEQDEKIAELTRQLAEALKDAKVYAAILVYGTEAVFPNGPATTDAEMMAAIDSATRALNESAAIKAKEQS